MRRINSRDLGTIKNDFSVLGKIGTKGAIHSEDNIPIGKTITSLKISGGLYCLL